jgi:hypothetical protein
MKFIYAFLVSAVLLVFLTYMFGSFGSFVPSADDDEEMYTLAPYEVEEDGGEPILVRNGIGSGSVPSFGHIGNLRPGSHSEVAI